MPSHKLLPNTNIAIDAFMHTRAVLGAVEEPLWFLTHFHGDHYAGMSNKWNHGPIFCSPITARLVRNAFGQAATIIPLPLHQRIQLDGVRVTFIDAHHCPGAVIIIFETEPFIHADNLNYDYLPEDKRAAYLNRAYSSEHSSADIPSSSSPLRSHSTRHGRVYVHGGDMRYHASMRQLFLSPTEFAQAEAKYQATALSAPRHSLPHTLLSHLPSTYVPCEYPSLTFQSSLTFLRQLRVHSVFLDTTYCNPRYRFPPQAISIAHTLAVVGECLAREKRYGVSALVDKVNPPKSGPMVNFFRQFAASNSDAQQAAKKVEQEGQRDKQSEAVGPVAPSSAPLSLATDNTPRDDGITAFFTQADSNTESDAKGDNNVAIVATDDQNNDCSDESIDLLENDHANDDEAVDGGDAVPPNDDDDNDEELEDLMMRDYDRPDEDDPVIDDDDVDVEDKSDLVSSSSSAGAASSSSLSSSLSNAWSTVSAGVTTISRNLSLSASFLGGYKQRAISKTLFLVGSYSIGKEKIFIEIAKQYGLKIFVPAYRLRTMRMLDLFDEDVPSMTSADSNQSDASPSPHTAAASSSSSSSSFSSPAKPPPVSTHFSSPPKPTSNSVEREWSRWSIDSVMTTKIHEARLHVIPLSTINQKMIHQHLDPAFNKHMPGDYIKQFHHVVAFRPTGWVGNKPTHSEKSITVTIPPPTQLVPDPTPPSRGPRRKPKMVPVPVGSPSKHSLLVSFHGVPYSEHSTFPELTSFVETLAECGLTTIIPTVNVAHCRDMVNKEWGHLLKPNQENTLTTMLHVPSPTMQSPPTASNPSPPSL